MPYALKGLRLSEQITTEVEIFGNSYTLVSEKDSAYAKEVAAAVDGRMVRVASSQNLSDVGKIAIMTALEIADEIITSRDRRSADARAAEMGRVRLSQSIDEANAGQ